VILVRTPRRLSRISGFWGRYTFIDSSGLGAVLLPRETICPRAVRCPLAAHDDGGGRGVFSAYADGTASFSLFFRRLYAGHGRARKRHEAPDKAK